MKAVLFLMLFSLIVQAEDCINCTGELKFPGDAIQSQITELQKPTLVNCADVRKTAAETEYLENFAKLPKKTSMVKGMALNGSAQELSFLAKMLGDTPSEKWANAKGCKTVVCALEKVYESKEAAHRVLNVAKRDGYIISASRGFSIDNKPAGQLFTLHEIQQIDLAYKELPKKFKKLKSLDKIIRMPSGRENPKVPNAAAYASPGYKSAYYYEEGEITFLDSSFEGAEEWGPNVAVHELAHHVDFSKSDKTQFGLSEDNKDFLKLSGWKKSTKYKTDAKTGRKFQVVQWEHATDKKFITDYAATEPAEDFAESVAHYMYTPGKLKAIDPEKYNYIKANIFEGKEYLNEPDLGLTKADILNMCLESSGQINFWGDSFTNTVSESCLNLFSDKFQYTDDQLCKLNKAQIKFYLLDQITDEIAAVNDKIIQCNSSIDANRNQCYAEGDFRSKCSALKCDLPEQLKTKTKDLFFVSTMPKPLTVLKDKIGKENFIALALINGLADKKGISLYSSLVYSSNFLKNASSALNAKMESINFQFDNKEKALKDTNYYLMIDSDANSAFTTFHNDVLTKATKSQEKNRELIKAWAQKMQLPETPLYDELAETLKKYK